MERKLFDWEDYDILDTLVIHFYNCKLKKDIVEFKAGSEIDYITLDYDKGLITLQDGDEICTYELSLQIQ